MDGFTHADHVHRDCEEFDLLERESRVYTRRVEVDDNEFSSDGDRAAKQIEQGRSKSRAQLAATSSSKDSR